MSAALGGPGPMTTLAHGLRAKLLYGVHRVLGRLSAGRAGLQVYLLCAQPVGGPAKPRLGRDVHSEVLQVQPGDPLLAGLPRPAQVIAGRFAAGHRCYVIRVKGEFGGCIWIAEGAYDEDEVRCRYVMPGRPGNTKRLRSVWDFDVYVAPRFRTGRTLARLWQAVDGFLADDGVGWTISRIALYNAASVAAHERLGAVHLGTAHFLVLGPLQLAWLPQAPYLHISLGKARTPQIDLQAPA